jgi:hypothetical protein
MGPDVPDILKTGAAEEQNCVQGVTSPVTAGGRITGCLTGLPYQILPAVT